MSKPQTIEEKAAEYAASFCENKDLIRKVWLDGFLAGKRAKSEKKELDLSFISYPFEDVMNKWIDFKKEKKQAYTQKGIEVCYAKLLNLSDNRPDIALLVVDQSIANNYAGLFPLKDGQRNYYSKNQSSCERKDSVKDLANGADAVLRAIGSQFD